MGKQIETAADTKLSAAEQEAVELAEAAREKEWRKTSFLRELFLGNFQLDLVSDVEPRATSTRAEFLKFKEDLGAFLAEEVDSDSIDKTGRIPAKLRKKLAALGAFGMKISPEYGGLGFTQSEYNDALRLVASQDANFTALLSAHQSIGVPQPLMMFGSEDQKRRYLPKLAKGAVSAFALTEPEAGSDPGRMQTTVRNAADGDGYVLDGEKLWCTNGTIADFIVVMARHAEDGAISAFIVEKDWEGVEVAHRCHFMGLKALENGVLRFENVHIPAENLLWERGSGLKLALITLNTGRLSLPAAATGTAKTCLRISREWAASREQWGAPIGKHEAIAGKLAEMAVSVYAMDAISGLATGLSAKGLDIRLEAAVAKMLNTETGWRIVDDTLQIRGGRGYETADSLRARGEQAIPVERMLRDFRINLIFEGSSEILRLFIAREAVDKHLQIAGILLDPKAPAGKKIAALPGMAAFYAKWLGKLTFGWWKRWARYEYHGQMSPYLRFIEKSSQRLARQMFYAMLWHRDKLQKKQAILFRFVDIGAELFALTAVVCAARKEPEERRQEAVELAHQYARASRRRIKALFRALWRNDDKNRYGTARAVLAGEREWLEDGIVLNADESVAEIKRAVDKESLNGETFETPRSTRAGADAV